MFQLTIDGSVREYPAGTTWEQVAQDYADRFADPIAAVSADGKIRELFKRVTRDCTVSFHTLSSPVGHLCYTRTATMLLLKAVADCFGVEAANGCRVDFTIGNGLFIHPRGRVPATDESVARLKARMKELVAANLPFFKRSIPLEDCTDLFGKQGMADKVSLFRYRLSSRVNVYELDGYYDYYYGYMLPHTGYVQYFDLIAYGGGFMLLLPDRAHPTAVAPFVERRKLFETFMASSEWGTRIGLETVGDLNRRVCDGTINDVILIQEAEQDRRISEIARMIAARPGVRFILVAGPSSSGKTSFSHRLSIQLRALGYTPHAIGLDDYFVDRDATPLDADGKPDFECLEAIDTAQFGRDMSRLLKGEEVEMPSYNFKTGHREYNGHTLRLGDEDLLVIEGIHGLNPLTSAALPAESKFKIYISALTWINVDEHNRIPTTDARLLRRMVRDARTRGNDAKRTLDMWPSVRRGEERNIFPYQEEADVMFNSALIYELAVLKPFAEPLLFQIEKGEPEYDEAKRLLKFLDYFLGIPSEFLPNYSIAREFVGGSCFRV